MENALDGCVQRCYHYRATSFVPSRLLDLGPQMRLDSIRLIESSGPASKNWSYTPRYAALSYCWGSPLATNSIPHLRTTTHSLDSRKEHIREQTIPATILDAIKVCKALSIQYLWVDSLCIIQDEKSDWERESEMMTLIYKNAFFTICTPSSKSNNEGFLIRHWKHIAIPFRSRVISSIYGHYNLVASGTWQNKVLRWPQLDVGGTSWNNRGWTLQEFQMSNRILIFGESMVHFQCRGNVQSDNGYRSIHGLSRFIQTLDSSDDADDTDDADYLYVYNEKYYAAWERMLEDYGYRLFTVIEDKLPAISGMAKYIADETGDEYLAGLWKSQLPSALVWYAHYHKYVEYHIELSDLLNKLRSPTPYIAPSWSPFRLDIGFRRGFRRHLWRKSTDTYKSTVVDAIVKSDGENAFGRVREGRIRIRGRFTTVSSDPTRLPCRRDDHLWYTLDKGVITYYILDFYPQGNSCSREHLSRLYIESTDNGFPMHCVDHKFLHEAARHCLESHLPLHAAGHGSSSDLALTVSEDQPEQDSDRPESESGSSHSKGSSEAHMSK